MVFKRRRTIFLSVQFELQLPTHAHTQIWCDNRQSSGAKKTKKNNPGDFCDQKLITIKLGGEKSSQRENCREGMPRKPKRQKKTMLNVQQW